MSRGFGLRWPWEVVFSLMGLPVLCSWVILGGSCRYIYGGIQVLRREDCHSSGSLLHAGAFPRARCSIGDIIDICMMCGHHARSVLGQPPKCRRYEKLTPNTIYDVLQHSNQMRSTRKVDAISSRVNLTLVAIARFSIHVQNYLGRYYRPSGTCTYLREEASRTLRLHDLIPTL
jgi:hypothetical protein